MKFLPSVVLDVLYRCWVFILWFVLTYIHVAPSGVNLNAGKRGFSYLCRMVIDILDILVSCSSTSDLSTANDSVENDLCVGEFIR